MMAIWDHREHPDEHLEACWKGWHEVCPANPPVTALGHPLCGCRCHKAVT